MHPATYKAFRDEFIKIANLGNILSAAEQRVSKLGRMPFVPIHPGALEAARHGGGSAAMQGLARFHDAGITLPKLQAATKGAPMGAGGALRLASPAYANKAPVPILRQAAAQKKGVIAGQRATEAAKAQEQSVQALRSSGSLRRPQQALYAEQFGGG